MKLVLYWVVCFGEENCLSIAVLHQLFDVFFSLCFCMLCRQTMNRKMEFPFLLDLRVCRKDNSVLMWTYCCVSWTYLRLSVIKNITFWFVVWSDFICKISRFERKFINVQYTRILWVLLAYLIWIHIIGIGIYKKIHKKFDT